MPLSSLCGKKAVIQTFLDCYTIKKAFSWVSFGLGHRPLSICILHGLTLIKMHNNATPQNFLKRRYAASFFLTSRLTSKKPTERAVLTNQGELRSSPIGTNRARFHENTSHLSFPGHEKLGQRPAVRASMRSSTWPCKRRCQRRCQRQCQR